MMKQPNWWEPIFSGELEVGLNKDRAEDIDQESFLYFEEAAADMETHI